MADVVLALRRKWLELILGGVKTAEFRRLMPADLRIGDRVYLYHNRALHGVAVVDGLDFSASPNHPDYEEDCFCLALSYAGGGCLDPQEAFAYLYHGRRPGVILLRDVQRFLLPQVWDGSVVQNFVYYDRKEGR